MNISMCFSSNWSQRRLQGILKILWITGEIHVPLSSMWSPLKDSIKSIRKGERLNLYSNRTAFAFSLKNLNWWYQGYKFFTFLNNNWNLLIFVSKSRSTIATLSASNWRCFLSTRLIQCFFWSAALLLNQFYVGSRWPTLILVYFKRNFLVL